MGGRRVPPPLLPGPQPGALLLSYIHQAKRGDPVVKRDTIPIRVTREGVEPPTWCLERTRSIH